MSVDPIPAGHRTVTPYLVVPDADALIEFLVSAFGAKDVQKHTSPTGRVVHAELQIGDSKVMLGQASEEWSPMPSVLHLYVPDTDEMYRRALEAGAASLREPEDQPYGDRSAGVEDVAGNQWWIATHIEDVAPEELERRMAEQAD